MRMPLVAIVLYILSSTNGEVCLTAGCLEAAKNILTTYDTSFDPCEDFYNFACGKFLNSTSIPPELGEFGKVRQVIVLVENQTRELLESEEVVSVPPKILQMTRMYYTKCLEAATPIITKKDDFVLSNKLYSLVKHAKNHILFNLTDLLIYIKDEFAADPLFDIYVTVDRHNKTLHVIYLDELNLILGSKSYYLNEEHKSRLAAYKKYGVETAKLLSHRSNFLTTSNDYESITEVVNKIVDFEAQLANITKPPEHKRNATERYNKLTIAEMQQLMPQVDWKLYLRHILPIEYEINRDTTVVVMEPNYFSALSELLNRTESITVIKYCAWDLIMTYTELLDSRYTSLRQRMNKEFYGMIQEPPRYKVCIRKTNTNLDLAMGAIYADKYFGVSSQAEISCTKYSTNALNYHLARDTHSIERFRVRGILSNLKEFADTFKCKANTAYNPVIKCEMW